MGTTTAELTPFGPHILQLQTRESIILKFDAYKTPKFKSKKIGHKATIFDYKGQNGDKGQNGHKGQTIS